MGITSDEAELLRDALLDAAQSRLAGPMESDDFGERYRVEFEMEGPSGSAWIRSGWIVRTGEDFPRFVTCHVMENRDDE